MAQLNDVPGGVIARVVGQKQDDIQLQLGQMKVLQKRRQHLAIELPQTLGADKQHRQKGRHGDPPLNIVRF